MTTTETAPVPRRTPGWMKVLLVVSLAVNVVVAGLFAGYLMKGGRDGAGPSRQVQWIIKLVPESRRDETREHFRGIRDDMRAASIRRVEHLAEIVAAIRAEPYSDEVMREALSTWRDASMNRRVVVHDRLASLIGGFNAADRSEFADNLDVYLERLEQRRNR